MSFRTLLPLLTFVSGFVVGVLLSTLIPQQNKSLELVVHSVEQDHKIPVPVAPVKFDLNNMATKKYLSPEYVPHHTPVRLHHPAHLRQEYKLRKTLFVGVLSSQMYLPTRAKAVYDTWAADVSMLVFFVGQDCVIPPELAHLPIIKLQGIADAVYPPLQKAFAVMKYMYEHFVNDYNWFIRADDDVYMQGKKLMDLLETMDQHELISLGRAGEGKMEDMDRLQLLKHERYCMGGPGMIFSRGMMLALGPYLNLCLEAIFYHDKQRPQFPWNDDDVEIGRCISRELDVQCSTSNEAMTYFNFDYTGGSLDTATLWTTADFRQTITIHPIKDPAHLRSVHLFYQTLEYEELFVKKQSIDRTMTHLCKNLPQELVPPSFLKAECNIEFGALHSYDVNRPTEKRTVHQHHKKNHKW